MVFMMEMLAGTTCMVNYNTVKEIFVGILFCGLREQVFGGYNVYLSNPSNIIFVLLI